MVFAICNVFFLDCRRLLPSEIKEVNGPVAFVVEVFGVVEHEAVAHVGTEVLAIEIVVPSTTTFRDHEETQKLITQDHLDFFVQGTVVVWGIRISSAFFVHLGPLHPCGTELVNR